MKPMKIYWKLALAAGLLAFSFSSCDEAENAVDNALGVNDGIEVANQYNMGQAEVNSALTYADNAMRQAGLGGRTAGIEDLFCASFSHDKEANEIVLDFGNDGCEGNDGRLRKGKITVNYIGSLGAEGNNARTVRFDSYSVDGNVLDGTAAATKWELDDQTGELSSSLTATGMSYTFAEDGSTFSWTGAWERKLSLVNNDFSTSTYTLTGSSTGTTRNGNTFAANIASPLTYTLSCLQGGVPYATSGERNIGVDTRTPVAIIIDYGNGSCDKEVEVTVNGKTSTHTLP